MKLGRLYSSSLVVFVSPEDPRKLTLYHHKRNAIIIEVKFSNSILSVRLNRKVVVVCTEDGIYIYDTENMKRKHKIEVTPSDRNGIFCLSTGGDPSVLAYPSTNMTGNVHVFNIGEMKNVVIIEAHQGTIAALEFNHQSDCLATASDKGTVIRLFKIPSGDKIGEFRRGFARFAAISCLSFSLDSQFLLVCSNTETVHIFSLIQRAVVNGTIEKDKTTTITSNATDGYGQTSNDGTASSVSGGNGQGTAAKWMNYFGSALKATTSFLPYPAQQMTEIFSQDRCFAVARISPPSSSSSSLSLLSDIGGGSSGSSGTVHSSRQSQRKVGAVVKTEMGWRIVVGTFDGYIHIFRLDADNGGEAELITTYDLMNGKHIAKNCLMTNEDFGSRIDDGGDKRGISESAMMDGRELNLSDENEFPPIQRA